MLCCTLACSLTLESLDLSLEMWSLASESIGIFFGSLKFHLEEEGVLGAVYRGEDECSELLCSIPLSYIEIVFSVLTGFSVNFTLRKQAVGIYLGTC
jgi:hypothetical protein